MTNSRSRMTTLFVALVGCGAALIGSAAVEAQTPDVSIANWSPAGTKSPYVRILDLGSYSDYFSAPEKVSVVKSQNHIYVKFDNNSLAIIPDGAVTVTAHYAEAASGLSPSAAATALGSVPGTAWRLFGSYQMMLKPPPGVTNWGLTSGSYPTSNEVGEPHRYRIVCSSDCSQPLPLSFFLRVTLSSPAGETVTTNNVAFSYYDPSGGVPSSDVVILHDVSGSMSGQLAVAKQRAKMFVDLLNAGDRVGVVAFSSQFAPADAKALGCSVPGSLQSCIFSIGSVHPNDPAKIDAKAAVNAFVASGMTPMGEGVQLGQQVLNAVPTALRNPNRAIVMLTDGKENWGADRLKDPPSYPIIAGLNSDSIGLYPLWFGPTSDWGKALLQEIDMQTSRGKLVEQPTDDLKLAEAYLMIRGILTSDDVYSIHRGTVGDGFQGTIFVDPITRELILTTAWSSFRRDLAIEVQPPGSQAWLPAESLAGSTSRDQLYVVHRFQSPPTGLWRYRLAYGQSGELLLSRRQTSDEYVLSALADQVEVLMQSSLEASSLRAGEPIVINAKLSRAGEPVSGAVVRATVEVPDQALGTLLHKYRAQFKTPTHPGSNPDVPRAAGIRGELSQLLGRDTLFEFDRNTVLLADSDGDGVYSGAFSDTKVAGTYRITIVAESTDGADEDGFRREHRHAAVVSLGPIDDRRSEVTLSALDQIGRDGNSLWKVTVIPADIYGNFADPGYSADIQVTSTGGGWVDELADNDDGSYVRLLELPAGDRAQIAVTAFGTKLGEVDTGTRRGGRVSSRKSYSLHAGGLFPSGAVDDVLESGPSFAVDFGYHLRPQMSLLAVAGWHSLSRDFGSGSETILQLSVNLRQRLTNAQLSPYAQFGPGVYRVFGDWEPGINLGIGATYQATANIDLEGGIDHHNIFLSGEDARFWQAHLGFSIRP